MGMIVCQYCGAIIAFFESHKVKTLYGAAGCSCNQTARDQQATNSALASNKQQAG